MAITTSDGLVAALASGQDIVLQKTSQTTVAGQWHSLWGASGIPGAGALAVGNTTTGIVPTDATAGCPLINAFGGGNTGYVVGFDCNGSTAGAVRLYDRLWHLGSILMTATGATAVTPVALPARLPASNAGGVGIEMWLEVNVALSATATTISVSYTNSAGVAGRTATIDGNLSGLISGRMMPFRLQAGDLGVQSIQTVTLAGTAGTSGSFNIILARTLAEHNVMAVGVSEPRQDPFKTGMPQVYADSALALMWLPTATNSGNVVADLDIANG